MQAPVLDSHFPPLPHRQPPDPCARILTVWGVKFTHENISVFRMISIDKCFRRSYIKIIKTMEVMEMMIQVENKTSGQKHYDSINGKFQIEQGPNYGKGVFEAYPTTKFTVTLMDATAELNRDRETDNA